MSEDKNLPNPAWVTAPYQEHGVADDAMITYLKTRYPADRYALNISGPYADAFGLYFYDIREKQP